MIGSELRCEEHVRATRSDGEEGGRAKDHDNDGEENGDETNAPPRTEPGQRCGRTLAGQRLASSPQPGRQRLVQQLLRGVPQQTSGALLLVSLSPACGARGQVTVDAAAFSGL